MSSSHGEESESTESHSQRPTPVTSPRTTAVLDSSDADALQSVISPRVPASASASAAAAAAEDAADTGSGTLVAATSLTYSEREVALLQRTFALLVQRAPQTIALLFAQTRKGDHDRLAACLVHLALALGGAVTLPLLQHFIRDEFAQRARDGTVMRENALASKLVKAYLARVGVDYLVDVLGKLVQGVVSGKEDLEIDTARIDTDEAVRNLPRLERKVAELLALLRDSVARLPPGLRLIAQYTAAQAREFLADAEEQQHLMVGAVIFLRYINPAIATPDMVRGLLKPKSAPLQPRARRNLVLLTKILQCLSNGTLFGSKEGYMLPLNAFVKAHQEHMRAFFAAVLDYHCNPALIHDGVAPERLHPDAVDLQRFHALLFTHRDALLALLATTTAPSAGDAPQRELEQLLATLGSYQHKLSFALLDAQDQAHVSRVLEARAEEAVYVGAADATVLGDRKSRALVLIVGRYTLLLLKRGSGRVYSETHLLDLVRVSLDAALITLVLYARLPDKATGPLTVVASSASAAPGSYAGAAAAAGKAGSRRSADEALSVALQCASPEHATQIVLAIRRQYRASFSGVPAAQRLEVRGVDAEALVGEHAALSACGGVVDTYRALCVYYDVQPSAELAWDLAHLYARSRTLDFDRFTTLREGASVLGDREALPLLHALAYNTYFVRVELRGLKFDRATLHGLVQLVAHNGMLRALTLRALALRDHSGSSSWGFFTVFDAMRESAALALTELECAQCELTHKDLQQLAAYLAQATRQLVRLDLGALATSSHQESARAEAMRALLWALTNNALAMRYLQHLSLAGNRLEGLEPELSKLLAKRGEALQRLDLADTRLRLGKLTWPRTGALDQLRVLCLAHQRLAQDALPAELLTWLTQPTCALEQLDLSGTQLHVDALQALLRACSSSGALKGGLQLTLAHNGYTRDHAASLASALTGAAHALVALDVSDNPLGDEGVQALAEALYHHRALTRLHVDRTFRYTTPKARRDCLAALTQLLTASALPLATLSMAAQSKDKDARLKDALVPLLSALGQARRLTALDVSGHAVGDAGLIALGKALETTRSLRRLLCDDNGATLVGLRALSAALAVNRSLTEFPLPLLDVTRLLGEGDSDKPDVLATVHTLQQRLARNQRL